MAMKGLWQRLTTPSSSRSGAEDDDDIDSDHGGGVDGQVDTADNENELDGDSGDRSVVQRRSLPLAVSGVGQLRTAVHVASAVADTLHHSLEPRGGIRGGLEGVLSGRQKEDRSGARAHAKGDYVTAANYWQRGADKGYPVSQYNLAMLYKQGRGVRRDVRVAFRLFARAANHDCTPALVETAKCYELGVGVERDIEKALQLYTSASHDPRACLRRGALLMERHRDAREAAKLVVHAALDRHHPMALNLLGYISSGAEKYRYIEEDTALAYDYLRQAAAEGFLPAMYNIGRLYWKGIGLPKPRFQIAFKWMKRAAEGGHAAAMFILSVMHGAGEGTPMSQATQLMWCHDAAKHGDTDAMVALAHFCCEGALKCEYTGFEWLRRAARHHNQRAMKKLASSYSKGIGVTKDLHKAERWRQRFKEWRDNRSLLQRSLGLPYNRSQHTPSREDSTGSSFTSASDRLCSSSPSSQSRSELKESDSQTSKSTSTRISSWSVSSNSSSPSSWRTNSSGAVQYSDEQLTPMIYVQDIASEFRRGHRRSVTCNSIPQPADLLQHSSPADLLEEEEDRSRQWVSKEERTDRKQPPSKKPQKPRKKKLCHSLQHTTSSFPDVTVVREEVEDAENGEGGETESQIGMDVETNMERLCNNERNGVVECDESSGEEDGEYSDYSDSDGNEAAEGDSPATSSNRSDILSATTEMLLQYDGDREGGKAPPVAVTLSTNSTPFSSSQLSSRSTSSVQSHRRPSRQIDRPLPPDSRFSSSSVMRLKESRNVRSLGVAKRSADSNTASGSLAQRLALSPRGERRRPVPTVLITETCRSDNALRRADAHLSDSAEEDAPEGQQEEEEEVAYVMSERQRARKAALQLLKDEKIASEHRDAIFYYINLLEKENEDMASKLRQTMHALDSH